jgi:hypothetical protein
MHRLQYAQACVGARKPSNRLVQECITDPERSPDAFAVADEALPALIDIVGRLGGDAGRLGFS